MMIKKTLGLLLSIVGVIGVAAYSIPNIKKAIPVVAQLNELILVIISVVILLVGLFLATKGGGSGRQPKEVPIYHGKHVVGYRRH